MIAARFLSALVAGAFFLAAPAAHATDLWQGARHGDSAEEILAKFEEASRPSDPETLDDESVVCEVWIEQIEVVSQPFRVCFFFTDDELVQVMLTLKTEPSGKAGQTIFSDLLKGLRSRYGEEDSLRRENGVLTIHEANWTGSSLDINLILIYLNDGDAMALNGNYWPSVAVENSNL